MAYELSGAGLVDTDSSMAEAEGGNSGKPAYHIGLAAKPNHRPAGRATLERHISQMRLFGPLDRIQLRMSATFSLPAPFTASASLLFSTLMADDKKSVALGLRRRDPELLDRLIEQ